VSKSTDGTTEQVLDALPGLSAGARIQGLFWVEAPEPPQGLGILHQQLTGVQESLLGIRTPKNEVKQVPSLLVRDSFPLADLFPEKPDLLIYDVAQPQPTRHRLSGIFRGQNLGRKVQCPNHFQER
jgi:hypothetical protein